MDYLRTHPERSRVPGTREDVAPDQSLLLRELCGEMKRDGLYASSTEDADVRWGIRVLIDKLKQESLT